MSFISSLSGSRVLVFGAGVTGKPTIEFLEDKGATPLVVDEKVSGAGIYGELA